MTEQRERVVRDANDAWHDEWMLRSGETQAECFSGFGSEQSAYEAGFIAGRTVTAEQVEAAADALWRRSPFDEELAASWEGWSRQNPNAAELWKDDVRFTLTAAGLLIEGEDDD